MVRCKSSLYCNCTWFAELYGRWKNSRYVIAFLQSATIPEEIPNTKTLESMRELEEGGGEVFEGSAHDFLQMMLEDWQMLN